MGRFGNLGQQGSETRCKPGSETLTTGSETMPCRFGNWHSCRFRKHVLQVQKHARLGRKLVGHRIAPVTEYLLSHDTACPTIPPVPGYRLSQDTSCPRIPPVTGFRPSQNTACPRIHPVPGYRLSQDTACTACLRIPPVPGYRVSQDSACPKIPSKAGR